MTPVAIITGASSGIGAELARVFAGNGHALVLVARREARLKTLAAELEAAGATIPLILPIDLSKHDAVARIALALEVRDLEPQFVVNNAGFGLHGYAAERDRDELLSMIDLNMRALTDLSLAFVAQPDAPSRRHSQRRVGRGLSAGPGVGGLLRQQGLCDLVQRGAVS